MQNSFDTSFIPQQPLLKVAGFDRRRESLNLAIVLSLGAFFIVLFVAVGVYFFHRKVVGEVLALAVELEDKEKLIDIYEIDRLKSVDLRIVAAKNLLQDHTVFTIILNFLEAGTLKNIGITSLSYANSPGGSIVSLVAEAPTYEAVYSQGETWRSMKPLVEKVDISSVVLAEATGVVTFITKITINHGLTRYAEFLKSEKMSKNEEITEPGIIPVMNDQFELDGTTSSIPVSPAAL